MPQIHPGRTAAILALAVLFAAAFLSCPNPLTQVMSIQVKDGIPPSVSITSPSEASFCANIVEVAGTATDQATSGKNDGRIRSLTYEIPGSAVSGTVAVQADGSFRFQFSTANVGTNFTLTLTAVDWNGNRATRTLSLVKQQGNGIPSFAVAPASRQVALSWDPIPHTASYTLYYTTNGALPSEQVGIKLQNVTSPLVLSGLVNGNMHIFQLRAVPEEGWPDSLSIYLQAIPLSAADLVPVLTGEYQQTRLEWKAISATNQFEVWRSTAQGGPYYNLSGPIQGTTYVDRNVSTGGWYWYKVRPNVSGSVMSDSNQVQPESFSVRPTMAGRCPTTNALAVAVRDSYAYVADEDELKVINISNPSFPIEVGTCEVAARGVAVSGSYAYVVDGGTAVTVIDVSNPSLPAIVETCSVSFATSIAVSGTHAYVVGGGNFFVIDVSNPSAPSVVGTCSAGNGNSVAVSGSHAYVGDSSVLQVVDISNPSSPAVVGSSAYVGNCVGVAVSGSYACVAVTGGLSVVDVSDPSSPMLVGSCTTHSACGVAVSGPYAFVADGIYGLNMIKISNPSSPTSVGTCATLGAGNGVAASGSHVYLADGSSGLGVIAAPTPRSPSVVGGCATGSAFMYSSLVVTKVAVNGPYAYVATSDGFDVIDVSVPSSPAPVDSFSTGTPVEAVVVRGNYAYLAEPLAGLAVVDVSNPLNPRIVGSCATYGGAACSVAVSGSYAYVTLFLAGLAVVDISDPASPAVVAPCVTSGGAFRVAVQGSHAYVAEGTSGLTVVDISDPSSPIVVGTCPTTCAYNVALSGSHAFVADSDSGLRVIDISNPAMPTSIATYPTPFAMDVAIIGSYAFVEDSSSGLSVIDISNPGTPAIIGSCAAVPGSAIAASGSHAYVADGSHLKVIDLLP